MANLEIALYTTSETGAPKSYVIFGDTKPYREQIKAIGGHFTKNFTHSVPNGCECGWIISASKYELAQQLCESPDTYETTKRSTTKRKTKTTARRADVTAEALKMLLAIGLSAETINNIKKLN